MWRQGRRTLATPAALRPSLLSLRPQTACFNLNSTEGRLIRNGTFRHIKNPQDFYTFFLFHSTEGRHIKNPQDFYTFFLFHSTEGR
ncbi:MAG: hypothetical protein AB7D40_11350, partial [Bacteroidales bacterium]